MSSTLPALFAVGTSFALFMAVGPARADASAWMFVGGGAMVWKQGDAARLAAAGATEETSHFAPNGTMTIDVGVGTTPDARVIVGGLFRIQPLFEHGADLALLARVCTHGFQAGDFGLALDVGSYVRTWGPLKGGGFAGALSLAAPLGFTLSLQTHVGSSQAMAFGAVAGIDLLRLTVYRQTLLAWWRNPSPAWKIPPSSAASTSMLTF